MAGLLGLGGPKRLVLTFLAMASISEAGIGGAGDITLIVTYIVIATALVWVPVGIVVVAGDRAAVILEHSQSWLTSHAAALRVSLSLGIGVALVAGCARAPLCMTGGCLGDYRESVATASTMPRITVTSVSASTPSLSY